MFTNNLRGCKTSLPRYSTAICQSAWDPRQLRYQFSDVLPDKKGTVGLCGVQGPDLERSSSHRKQTLSSLLIPFADLFGDVHL